MFYILECIAMSFTIKHVKQVYVNFIVKENPTNCQNLYKCAAIELLSLSSVLR